MTTPLRKDVTPATKLIHIPYVDHTEAPERKKAQ